MKQRTRCDAQRRVRGSGRAAWPGPFVRPTTRTVDGAQGAERDREGKLPGRVAVEALRQRARAAELAGLVVFSPVNLRYLSGFHSNAYSRPLALVVPADGDPTRLVPRLEEHQAHDLSWVGDI